MGSEYPIVQYDKLQSLDGEAIKTVQSIEGGEFNEALARQFFLMTKSKDGSLNLFIRKAGLLHKLNGKHQGKAVVQAEPVTGEEYERFREMDGIPDGQRYFVFRAKVFIPGIEQPFTSYGSASMSNCRNNRLLEMAETRATNRAIRLATSCGFTSEEEYMEKMTTEEVQEIVKLQSPPATGNEALSLKDIFFEKYRAIYGKPQTREEQKIQGQNIIDFIVKAVGKHPRHLELTREDYVLLIKVLEAMEDTIAEPSIDPQREKFLEAYRTLGFDYDPQIVGDYCQQVIGKREGFTDEDYGVLIQSLEGYLPKGAGEGVEMEMADVGVDNKSSLLPGAETREDGSPTTGEID